MDIIEIKNLKKYYGELKAVDDISFQVRQGEFFAFLGVNGAGKSTTISILCGLPRTSGSVKVCGVDVDENPAEVRRKIGVVFQNSVLDKSLSVQDNLRYRAALYQVCGEKFQARLKELTELFDLKKILKQRVGTLSGGQRRRVDIARALVHRPQILILDEPTTGLDPQTRKNVWETIHTIRKENGMTVFLTTHYMEEASDADRVVILDAGKILANATPLELKTRYTGDYITIYRTSEDEIREFGQKNGLRYEKCGDGYRFEVKDTAAATELILNDPKFFRDYEITKGKMDDVFLNVTGKSMKGEIL